jgi:hypothetical protein
VPKQRTLREVHVLCNGRRGDLAGVLRGRQLHDSLHGSCAAFVRWQVFGMHIHKGLDK